MNADYPHWLVVSGAMDDCGDWIMGHCVDTYIWHETARVAAATKREAMIQGIKEMTSWPRYARQDLMTTPFNGVTVEDARCKHGYCAKCDIADNAHGDVWHPGQDDYCKLCIREGDNEYQPN